jgi:hypothetical protein
MSLTISHLDEQKYLKGEESIRNFWDTIIHMNVWITEVS